MITADVLPGAGRAYADPRALQQALLNIVTNAVDALEERNAPRVDITVMRNGGTILVRVADNGRGTTEAQQKDLFKPFYTSKPHGTGLGLVIVKKLLTKMNGDVSITSSPDRGTTVEISLPEGRESGGGRPNERPAAAQA